MAGVNPQDGFEFARRVTAALGLPKYTKWFELRWAVDEAVTVTCAYYPEKADGTPDLVEALSEYQVVKRAP